MGRPGRMAAWLLWTAGIIGSGYAALVWAGQRFAPPPIHFADSPLAIASEFVFALACLCVGLILATKRARNPIGWIYLGIGVSLVVMLLTNFSVSAGHQVLRPLSAETLASAWFFNAFELPFCGLMSILLFLWFPDGRCLTPRWNWVALLAVAGASLLFIATGTNPRGMIWYPSLANPLAFPPTLDILNVAIAATGLVAFVVSLALATWSLVLRFRVSDVERRIQLRLIAAAGVALGVSATPFLVVRYGFDASADVGRAMFALMLLAATLMPIATAIAILRYHVLAIDLLINRAVVYLALSGILGGIYTATILVFQKVFVAVTGNQSDVAFVLATLVLASVFTPVRKWLEGFVDKYVKPASEAAPEPISYRETANPGIAGWDYNAGEPMPVQPAAASASPLSPARTHGEPLAAAASLGAAAAHDAATRPAVPASDEAARIADLEARLRLLEEQLRRGK